MSAPSGPADFGSAMRRFAILAGLIAAVALLHFFATPAAGIDPTAMLALGFIVLASYSVGELGKNLKLPDITGYLFAGLLFGPSGAALLPHSIAVPPFDRGILSPEIVSQLSILDTLAVALIALTCGGELKFASLRKSFRAVLGMLGGQTATVPIAVSIFMFLVSGVVPAMKLPGLPELTTVQAWSVGLLIATCAMTTSPSAAIAVITGSRAQGPVSSAVMQAVIFEDIVVSIMFAITSAIAVATLGLTSAGSDTSLVSYLASHLGLSLAIGAVVGFAIAAYLKYVNKEVMLFLVGVVYSVSLVIAELHLDPIMLFIAAGFVTANFSKEGDRLIHNIEQLAQPVYVVFFTLAGAKLHMDHLVHLFPFAIGLVLTRAITVRFGVMNGTRIVGAEPMVQKWAWVGFVSQAGVALSFAARMGRTLGELGRTLETLLIACIAINEFCGPIFLKFALTQAGEIEGGKRDSEAAKEPAPAAADLPVARRAPRSLPPGTGAWPEARTEVDPFGAPARTASPELDQTLAELDREVREVALAIERGPIEAFQSSAREYLLSLRREFLRHHRRVAVKAREGEANVDEIRAALRSEQRELAERWRAAIVARSAQIENATWAPEVVISGLDAAAGGLPEHVLAAYEPSAYEAKNGDSTWTRARRVLLRVRRVFRRAIGQRPPEHAVPLRALARYYLSGVTPTRLESLAALLVRIEIHLASRTRNLLDDLVRDYDAIADKGGEQELENALTELRQNAETHLTDAISEIDRMSTSANARARSIIGDALVRVKAEAPLYGTFDLPERERRSSAVFYERIRAMETISQRYREAMRSAAGAYAVLALEVELIGLEAQVKDALAQYASRIENDVRGKAFTQGERALGSVDETIAAFTALLDGEPRASDLVAHVRFTSEPLARIADSTAKSATALHDQLVDEQGIAPLLDALSRATLTLTETYVVPSSRPIADGDRLPSFIPLIEVPFRELVTAYIETTVAPKLLAACRGMAERVMPLAAALGELERRVAFHVEIASGELDVVGDEPTPRDTLSLLRDVLVAAFGRSRDVLAAQVEAAGTWPGELSDGIRAAVLGGIDELRARLAEGQVSALRLQIMRQAAVGKRLISRAEQLPDVLVKVRDAAVSTMQTLLGEEGIETVRVALGLPSAASSAMPEPASFDPPVPRAAVPVVYRRLFSAEELETAEVASERVPLVERAQRTLSGTVQGGLRTVAVVGTDGVGKSAFLNAVLRSRAWRHVRRIAFTHPVDVVELEELLQKREHGRTDAALVVVTGLHWLLAARPGGFSPLRHLVEHVIADGGRNAFLIEMDRVVFDYACTVAPLRDAFAEIVRLTPMGREELEAAVLARHRMSGYELAFESSRGEQSGVEELFARGASRLRRPQDHFFEGLHAASGGVLRDALRLWLAAIESVNESESMVRMGPLPASLHGHAKRIPDDVLVKLYPIARQGWMNAHVQGHLFRCDEVAAEAQLTGLVHLGLLERGEHAYRIATHLRGAIYRVFAERGWVA